MAAACTVGAIEPGTSLVRAGEGGFRCAGCCEPPLLGGRHGNPPPSVSEARFTARRTVFLGRYRSGSDVNSVFRGARHGLPDRRQTGAAPAWVIATSREIARRYFFR
ncbi:hypothetical protein GCM10009869_23480 [Amnibacterium kyonggiense]